MFEGGVRGPAGAGAMSLRWRRHEQGVLLRRRRPGAVRHPPKFTERGEGALLVPGIGELGGSGRLNWKEQFRGSTTTAPGWSGGRGQDGLVPGQRLNSGK